MERERKTQHIYDSCEGSKQPFDMMCLAVVHAGVFCVLSHSSTGSQGKRDAHDWPTGPTLTAAPRLPLPCLSLVKFNIDAYI